jgi:hypothetical protein
MSACDFNIEFMDMETDFNISLLSNCRQLSLDRIGIVLVRKSAGITRQHIGDCRLLKGTAPDSHTELAVANSTD